MVLERRWCWRGEKMERRGGDGVVWYDMIWYIGEFG